MFKRRDKFLKYFMDIVGFLLFTLTATGTPGPNNIMVLASGVNFGYKRTIPHLLGIAIGYAIMIFILSLGGIQILERFPTFYEILRYIGIAYLLCLAFTIATTRPLSKKQEDVFKKHPFSFFQAALFQWVNPKAWLTSVNTVLVFFQPSDTNFFLVAGIMFFFTSIITFLSCSLWTFFGTQFRKLLTVPKYSRIFNISMAFLLVFSFFLSIL